MPKEKRERKPYICTDLYSMLNPVKSVTIVTEMGLMNVDAI